MHVSDFFDLRATFQSDVMNFLLGCFDTVKPTLIKVR